MWLDIIVYTIVGVLTVGGIFKAFMSTRYKDNKDLPIFLAALAVGILTLVAFLTNIRFLKDALVKLSLLGLYIFLMGMYLSHQR